MEFPSYLLQIPEMIIFTHFLSTPYLSLSWLSFRESSSSWEGMFFWVVSHSGFYIQIKAAILDQSTSQRHLSCLSVTLATRLSQELLKIYLILDCRRLSGWQWPDRSSVVSREVSLYLDDLTARWEIKLKACGLVNPTDSRVVLVQWWFLYSTELSRLMVSTERPFRTTLNRWDQCSVDPVACKLHLLHWPSRSYDLTRWARELFFELEVRGNVIIKEGHWSIPGTMELAFLKWLLGS